MVIKISSYKNVSVKIFGIILIVGLSFITIPNVVGTHYYQLQIFFEDEKIENYNVSLKVTQEKIPNLKHYGPYSLKMVSKKGKIIEEKKFDIRREVTVEKRLSSGEWENFREKIKKPGILINLPYNSSIEKAIVKKGNNTIGEIPIKKEINFSIKTCKDELCNKEKKIFSKNESVWIDYQSDLEGLKINTSVRFPDNSTKKIELPKRLTLEKEGKYIIKSYASKIGRKGKMKIKKIKVKESSNKLVNTIIGIGTILIIFTLLMLLRKFK